MSSTMTAVPPADDDLLKRMNDMNIGVKRGVVGHHSADHARSMRSGATKTSSPADFLHLQSLKSSALAHKSSTGTKFGGAQNTVDLFNTLLNQKTRKAKTPPPKVAAKDDVDRSCDKKTTDDKVDGKTEDRDSGAYVEGEEEEEEEEEGKDGDLIERGPMRTVNRTNHESKPYAYPNNAAAVSYQYPISCAYAPGGMQAMQLSTCAMGLSYPASDGSHTSNTGSPSASSASYSFDGDREATSAYMNDVQRGLQQTPTRQQVVPFADAALTGDELARLLHVPSELPDTLSDFILKYSRRYAMGVGVASNASNAALHDHNNRKGSEGSVTSNSEATNSPQAPANGQDSPRSVQSFSARNGVSPSQPHAAHNPQTTPPRNARRTLNAAPAMMNLMTSGRDRIRACVPEKERDEAWLWMCKCTRSCPGAIYYTDPDGDSLLHIVVWHGDLAKMYALVEQMLKNDSDVQGRRPFDLPNKAYETPLLLAVQRRLPDAVWYLLDIGANPNAQNRRGEQDAALHYACSRGMTDIVEALCAHTATNVDLINGLGITPLLSAVRNHGKMDEESNAVIDNRATIRTLLRCGAQMNMCDRSNGRTALHYIVDRLDTHVVDILKEATPATTLATLSMQTDYNGDTPLTQLQRVIVEAGVNATGELQEKHKNMFIALVAIGGAGNLNYMPAPQGDN